MPFVKKEKTKTKTVKATGSFTQLVKNIPPHVFAGAVQKSGMPAEEGRRLNLLFKEL